MTGRSRPKLIRSGRFVGIQSSKWVFGALVISYSSRESNKLVKEMSLKVP